MADSLDCALDLLRRLPPASVSDNLSRLVAHIPELADDLLAAVDTPLATATCAVTGRVYLLCDYNRDGDAYRSPWSGESVYFNQARYFSSFNKRYSTEAGAVFPSPKIRTLEIAANDAFDTYRELYYEGGTCSVYAWDLDQSFAAAVLFKKAHDGGCWDAVHVLEIIPRRGVAIYKLTSTILLQLILPASNLAGSLTRQTELELPMATDTPVVHVANMGRMIEDMEIKMRGQIQEVYFGKTKDILNSLRSITDLGTVKQQAQMQAQLVEKLKERNT